MQTENNLFGEIKHLFRNGGMTIKLIFANLFVFLLISISEVIARLLGFGFGSPIAIFVHSVFTLQTDFMGFITHPWGLFTSIFAHYDFMHILWNMVFLYFSGKMFEQFFDQNRMLYTYILGGLFGGILEILAYSLFPTAANSGAVIGASGSVMAVLVALAFHRPKMNVALYGIINVPIILIAILFIVRDIFSLGTNDGVAHFAHLGGAIIGMVSIQNLYSSSNIITVASRLGARITNFFKVLFNPTKTPKMKVNKGQSTGRTFKSDEEFNLEKKRRQEKIDAILDKISKSGYESLTKEEKDFLFRQSNNA